jgi:hypothetical protein
LGPFVDPAKAGAVVTGELGLAISHGAQPPFAVRGEMPPAGCSGSPRRSRRNHERDPGRAAGRPIMARWFRHRVSPTTAARLQRCPAITLELHWFPSPCHWVGAAGCVTGFSDTSTTLSGRPPRAMRSRAERFPAAVTVGIWSACFLAPLVAGESRLLDCLVLTIDASDVAPEPTNAGSWMTSGLWIEGVVRPGSYASSTSRSSRTLPSGRRPAF